MIDEFYFGPLQKQARKFLNKSLRSCFRVSPNDIDDTTFTVKNLIEGKPYEFRVAAVNDAGVGAFAECDGSIKPQAPASKENALFVRYILRNKNNYKIMII